MLLRSIALSGIDQSEYEHAAAPYVSLAFIRRLSQEACDLFHCVFNKAHEFANLKSRNKLTFVRAKRSFAFDLGLVYSSVQSLISTNGNWAGSVCNAFCLHSGANPFSIPCLETFTI